METYRKNVNFNIKLELMAKSQAIFTSNTHFFLAPLPATIAVMALQQHH
jgi:hypothetical protein